MKSDSFEALVGQSEQISKNKKSLEDISVMTECNQVIKDLDKVFKKARENSRTAKLWLQYIDLIILVMEFIKAERTGNWKKHIETIKLMIPIFHSAGHSLYAKCAHLYLQLAAKYEKNMSWEDFEKFTADGFFTNRYPKMCWSGVWTDMVIEQSLNHPMISCRTNTWSRNLICR